MSLTDICCDRYADNMSCNCKKVKIKTITAYDWQSLKNSGLFTSLEIKELENYIFDSLNPFNNGSIITLYNEETSIKIKEKFFTIMEDYMGRSLYEVKIYIWW